MKFTKPSAKSDLEKVFLDSVEKDTPDKVRNHKLLDLNNQEEFTFTITKEMLEVFNPDSAAIGILEWFKLYKKEAIISTAGIRGLQNPLYPWDTRYPLNLIGVMLATLGKVKVAEEKPGDKTKISTCEVRYNSGMYVELIARIQAAYGIKTFVTKDYSTIPIFLISFIIFMYDLYGGEYVTSSHAMCRKIATKDLNAQGSQYIPSESLAFVAKVENILKEVEEKGQYTIKIAASSNPNVDQNFLESVNNGIDLYVKYLKQGIATETNLNFIKSLKSKLVVECMGGSMYNTLAPILTQLNIIDHYDFLHQQEDPFNHGIGKVTIDGKYFDWSCDATIMQPDLKTLDIKVPVLESINYEELLVKYPLHTVVLMTDPDADRLVTAYIESSEKIDQIKKYGLVYRDLGNENILVMFTPNQSFLLNIDFQKMALEQAGLWDQYDWFMLKTTASQRSWDEWAAANNVPIINTPVGFKELADAMINIERKLEKSDGTNDIFNKDVFGNNINLGKKPRMLFAGEESGGEIFGPAELISSIGGRKAVSMREKSAGEAIIITSALAGWLNSQNMSMLDYLLDVFKRNNIISRYEIRIDQKYYNESEPDIEKLLAEKEKGMVVKTNNNSYFLSLALGYRDGIINLDQVKEILSECFKNLIFDDLLDIKFVGDGTFILFKTKCLEVRPSGTDAVNKAYSYGQDQWESIKYAQAFSGYNGDRTPLHIKYIPKDFHQRVEDYSFEIYTEYKENQ